MAEAFFKRDIIGWINAFHTWDGVLGQHLKKKTVLMEIAAVVEAPKKTTALARSIKATYGVYGTNADLESTVIANSRHAIFVHGGTRPHLIEANGGGQLVFFWPRAGKVVHVKTVNHPGTRADPFLERAMRQVF